jgi:hypothetical protein
MAKYRNIENGANGGIERNNQANNNENGGNGNISVKRQSKNGGIEMAYQQAAGINQQRGESGEMASMA